MDTEHLVYLGMLYGSNMPMMFYYCSRTNVFYKKSTRTSVLEKVNDENEIRRLRMRLQNILEVA